jgi:hypothetical protein
MEPGLPIGKRCGRLFESRHSHDSLASDFRNFQPHG